MSAPDHPVAAMSDAESVLRQRARRLAQPLAQGDAGDLGPRASIDVLEFRLAGGCYALETAFVQEVQPLGNLTALPCTPAFVLGVVNLRGRVTAVLSLKKFFRLPEQGMTDLHRIIVVGHGDMEFGLLADRSVGVRRIARDSLQPSLPTASGIAARFVQGITLDGTVVLDMARILADPGLQVNEEPLDEEPKKDAS